MRSFSTIKRIAHLVAFPVLWLVRPYRFDDVWINTFADWFGGPVGFKQQTFVMGLWIDGVVQGWIHDPHMLVIMAVLTIYSAITQPMLAIASARTTKLLMEALGMIRQQADQIRQLQEVNLHQTKALLDVVTKLHELESHDAAQIAEIAEHLGTEVSDE